ncbi:3-deoxy-manno-octulosonate cytidylyltransferase [Alkalilacustris brevis]|uniref:3-deoxy-manno-octulosonate cytidylyltransferase n=1 Tax=Alkalilacustris brevis TaxID=2026338 RepID=UPI000E0DCE87|nr:3-deoxy-manno-octulosonate cytidylyltransferase [Alkalilacustris brevis]
MKTIILIPARYGSTRYPGKPLAELRLPNGTRKPLIQLTWEAAQAVRGVDGVHVATDDERIARAAQDFGAQVIMTSDACANGTERCADALARAGLSADVVVNLQGDAPLTPPWFIEALIDTMARDPAVQVTTPVLRCDRETHAHFLEDRRAGRVGGTTAVFDRAGNALYFSKEVLPYTDASVRAGDGEVPVFHHVGVYAYRPTALAAYGGWAPGRLEQLEGLEQLRFLENGAPVRCVTVEARGRVFWELNNPEDVARIEKVLEAAQ